MKNIFSISQPQKDLKESVKTLGGNLILYYRDHRDKAQTDIYRLLQKIKAINETEKIYWDLVIKYWSFVTNKLTVNVDVVPSDLPQDNSMCIVVLGYQLNPDGSMRSELIKRLEIALKVANKYTKSYIAVSGGPTGSHSRKTEGGEMGKWLIEKGIEKERVIIDEKAMSTVANARNVYRILSTQYPHINKIVMVTSDYHIKRGCLLYNTQLLMGHYEQGGPTMEIISNAACYTGKGQESDSLLASSCAGVAGVTIQGSNKLSKLEYLSVSSEYYYSVGDTPKFNVLSNYDTKFQRDVTEYAVVGPYDNTKPGVQTVTVSYEENNIRNEEKKDIYFS